MSKIEGETMSEVDTAIKAAVDSLNAERIFAKRQIEVHKANIELVKSAAHKDEAARSRAADTVLNLEGEVERLSALVYGA